MTIKRLLRQFSVLLLCVISTQIAFSQTKTITGKILDDKGIPIQGATVSARGSKGGTTTDASGVFKLNVPANAKTLVISSVGFNQQEIGIGDKDNFNVSLIATSASLNEVVVVGYGTVRKKDVTGSVSSLGSKDFNQGALSSPDLLLQNKIPGLEVATSGGQPGGATTLKIRGTNSILNTGGPLIVVDGVPLDGRDGTPALNLSSASFGSIPASNPLTFINPNDIAQIDILKDASASAIYGSRGANGVIVITTKKGGSGPIRLDFATKFTVNAGLEKSDGLLSASQFRSKLSQYTLDTGSNANFDGGASVNALKAISQNVIGQSYSLAFSGGNETGKFRASFLGSNDQGYIQKSDLDKYIGTFGGSYNFLDKHLIIDFNLIAAHTNQDFPLISNTAGSIGSLMAWTLNWNPTQPFYLPNGQLNLLALGSQINPIAGIQAYNDQARVNTVLANISARVKILSNLEYKFLYAIDNSTGTRYTSIDGYLQGITGVSGVGYANIGTATLSSQTFTHTLEYNTSITKDIKLDAIAGYEYWTTNFRNDNVTATGFDINNSLSTITSIPLTSQMTDATSVTVSGTPSNPTTDIQSFFGRISFNASDKYYLTGTMRADGSSKFGVNNKYGYFPSIAGRWVISNEGFMKGSAISNLALRGSWGITGDQGFPAGASQAQYAFNNPASIGQTNVPNPNLKWQQTSTVDLGIDYGILGGRIIGSLDVYQKNTTNLIYETTAIQPAPSGNEYINLNANLYNTGIEFAIAAEVVKHSKFSWTTQFNIADNKNQLKNYNKAPIQTGAINGNGVSGTFAETIANGQPLNEYYLPHFVGYTKAGNDSVTSSSYYAGDPNPHVGLGWNNTLTFDKLTVSFTFGGSFGYKVFNNTNLAVTNIYNFAKGFNTTNSAFQSGESINDGLVISDRYVENGAFLKLRNLRVSYNIGKLGQYIKDLNVNITGTNLFMITKFTGFDPEINIDKNNNGYPSQSMEYLPYPTPRLISAGVNFSL